MSGRGARSRKAIQKDIEKKEKKIAVKNKAKEEPYDGFAEWSPTPSGRPNNLTAPTRSLTISSDVSRTTSRSSSTTGSRPRLHTLNSNHSSEFRTGSRPKTSTSGSYSHSDLSSKGKEKSKYQAKGKETKAPRGRGGGVPVKSTATSSLAHSNGARAPSATPTAYRPPNQRSWINFRVWTGEDSGVRPYGGFDFDVDMQDGNVLVYFKEEQANDELPVPQIRCDLDVLENAGSTWLNNALLYGRIDDNDDDWGFAESSEATLSMQNYPPGDFPTGQRRMLSPISPGGRSPPPFDIDQYGVPLSGNTTRAGFYSDMDHGVGTPPPFQGNTSQKPTHELWFTAPAHLKTPQSQRLHHVAVRNFLALLHNKPIVGTDLFEMLSTLQPEIQVMYDLDQDNQSRTTPRERSVQMIINYLTRNKLDDTRNNIKNALALLAWSEQDTVKWRQGYLDNFVHLAGVINPEIEELPDFKRLSMMTRRNLGIAAKTLQLRVMEAEETLETFDLSELWEDSAKAAGSPVYQNYQSFRQFLISHYSKMYGNWPPTNKKTWLNRRIVLALQDDFGALYDYLVNRDVMWDPREARPGKKWEMSHRKDEDFKADLPELSLTDMLVKFDNKHGYGHIPHPYPLLPRQVQKSTKEKEKKSLFSRLKKGEDKDTSKDAKAHLQLSIVFSDATNLEKEDVNFNGSRLIDQFEQFELTTNLKHDTPREARLGRWVLLYGILQVLSTLSVDVQSLKYTEGVRYFLCTDLKRCPDWVTNGQVEFLEASQQRSWCWQRPWDPTPIRGAPSELDASNVARGELEGATLVPTRSPDGTMQLNQDIQRIGEKIDHMSLSHNANRMMREELDRRRENEKVMQKEFSGIGERKRMDDASYRLTESDFSSQYAHQHHQEQQQQQYPPQPQLRPVHPLRNPPLRSPVASMASDAGYFLSSNSFPVPPGYRNGGAPVRSGGYYPEEQPGMF